MAEEAIAVPAEDTPPAEPAAAPVDQAPEPEPTPAPAEPETFSPQQEEVVRRLILDRDQQWKQHYDNQAPAQTPAETPAEPTDDIESDISALYTDDEAGRATRRSVETHFDLLLKKNGIGADEKITLEDVERIASDRAALTENRMRSGLAINDEVSDLVKRNVISTEDAEIVQKAYTTTLSAPGMKDSAENPANAPYILKSVVYDLIKAGKLKPFSQRARPTNPLAPGGPAGPAQPVALSEDPKDSPFQAVRNLTKEQLAVARATDERNYARANG